MPVYSLVFEFLPFNKKDFAWIYNLALKFTGYYGDFMVRFHFQCVNPAALKMKPVIFGDVAVLGDTLSWVKVVLLCHCYLCHTDCYEEVGIIQYANGLARSKLEKLDAEFLNVAEEFL